MGSEYEVGYRKPPIEHRFKPGQSGNMGGRRRKAKDPFDVIREPVPMKVNGVSTPVEVFEAGLRKTAQLAFEGKLPAIKRFIAECEKAKILKGTRFEEEGGVLVVPRHIDFHKFKHTDANIAKLVQRRSAEQRTQHRARPKSPREAAVWKVASERIFLAFAGRKMSILEIILYKLKAMALKDGHEASLAYFHKLNAADLVEFDGSEVGYLIVPQGTTVGDTYLPIEDVLTERVKF